MTSEYRPDIDGLRAIAVLAVIAYHAGIPGFSGGFVGVDVFFVISGYLITGIIQKEIAAREFSLMKFYERRIRRIIPALTVVVVTTCAFAALILLPSDLERLGQSALGISIFASNIHFWKSSEYFFAQAADQPLLHTWSLSVEEQFYVFFPFLLILLHRFAPKQVFRITLLLFLLSLALSAAAVFIKPKATFYLAPTRAWELLAGSMLVLGQGRFNPSELLSRSMSVFGLLSIGGSILWFSEATVFPGLSALIPVGGTMLLIEAGRHRLDALNRILVASPLVFCGKISYSMYLWHFPAFALGQYALGPRYGVTAIAILFILTLAASILTWKYVEQPFRKRTFLSRNAVFGVGAAATCLMAAVGTLYFASSGLGMRMNGQTTQMLAQFVDENAQQDCFFDTAGAVSIDKACSFGEVAPPSLVLWGDSHAQMLRNTLNEPALSRKISGRFLGAIACPPVLGVEKRLVPACQEINTGIAAAIIQDPKIRTVILGARWAYYQSSVGFKMDTLVPVYLRSGSEPFEKSVAQNTLALQAGLLRTVELLRSHGKNVLIVGPVPEIGYNVPRALHMNALLPSFLQSDVRPTSAEFHQRNQESLRVLSEIGASEGIGVLFPHEVLCGAGRCEIVADGIVIYHDANHLSYRGSSAVSALLEAALPE